MFDWRGSAHEKEAHHSGQGKFLPWVTLRPNSTTLRTTLGRLHTPKRMTRRTRSRASFLSLLCRRIISWLVNPRFAPDFWNIKHEIWCKKFFSHLYCLKEFDVEECQETSRKRNHDDEIGDNDESKLVRHICAEAGRAEFCFHLNLLAGLSLQDLGNTLLKSDKFKCLLSTWPRRLALLQCLWHCRQFLSIPEMCSPPHNRWSARLNKKK